MYYLFQILELSLIVRKLVIPFAKAKKVHIKYRRMKVDLYSLHNLQPVIGEVNLLRSNYQISIINGKNRVFIKCNIKIKNNKVEPNKKFEEILLELKFIWNLITLNI